MKEFYFQRVLPTICNGVMQSTWQTDVANAVLEFSREARFKIFTQQWLLGNIKYFVSFKLKSLRLLTHVRLFSKTGSNTFRSVLIYEKEQESRKIFHDCAKTKN